MTRNLKALGLAFVAALALGAVVASTASAEFLTGSAATTVTAVAPFTDQVIEVEVGGKVTEELRCKKVTVDVTLAAKQNSVTAVPNYEECTFKNANGTFNLDVKMTSCYYLFTTNTTMHIECTTAGDSIDVNVTILGKETPCLKFPAQTPTSPVVHYLNEGTGETRDIKLVSTINGIAYTKTGACGSDATDLHNFRLTGEVTLTGENNKGEHVFLEKISNFGE